MGAIELQATRLQRGSHELLTLMQVEFSFRHPSWPWEKPDATDSVPESEMESTIEMLKAEGFVITDQRDVHWTESLANMESPAL